MTPNANLQLDDQGDLFWIRINRPESRNALSLGTLLELGEACRALHSRPALKALVITGSGAQAFAAGGDVKELTALRTAEQISGFFDQASTALDAVRNAPFITVAALNGLALGGGAELALACDYRVAVPTAKIGYIQARLNISPGFGGGTDLVRFMGPAAAMSHGLGAEILDAAAALERGLVDAVAAADESLETLVRRYLEPMLRQKPQVIRAYKAIAAGHHAQASATLIRQIEKEQFVQTWTHPDHWEAVEAIFNRWQEKGR